MAVRKLPSPNLESVRRQFSYDLDAAIDAYEKWSLELQGKFRRI